MLTSTKIQSSLALSALLVTLIVVPALAQNRDGFALRPGQVHEMIGPAAKVVSSVHYQAELSLNCVGGGCGGHFLRPGANRRLTITRVACVLYAQSGSTFLGGNIELERADNSHLLWEYLPLDFSSPDGFAFTLNRAVDMEVGSSDHITATLALASGTATDATCTTTGTLDTLQ